MTFNCPVLKECYITKIALHKQIIYDDVKVKTCPIPFSNNNPAHLSFSELHRHRSHVNLPLPPGNVALLWLVAGVDRHGVRGLPSARLQELVDKGVDVGQEGRGLGGVGPRLGRRVGDSGPRGHRGVQVEVRGSHVVPVDDDEEDHEGWAQRHEDAEHPGCSHSDSCSLQSHHSNRLMILQGVYMALPWQQITTETRCFLMYPPGRRGLGPLQG